MVAIAVHGGAWSIPDHEQQAARDGCLRALEHGHALLTNGASALDAVEAAVRLLEDDPVFDAGTGSHPARDGEVEMDAIIVRGDTLDFGAVAALSNVRNPISVARRIMEDTPHAMLAGQGATQFAHEAGFEFAPTAALAGDPLSREAHGTVGAVAVDAAGHIAAATSTGGTRGQMRGRVGDSPLIGCGACADDASAGVSATGHGESLMKVMMARTVAQYVEEGRTPQAAAEAGVQFLKQRVNGKGGVICVDPKGALGYAYTTAHMAAAMIDHAGNRRVAP